MKLRWGVRIATHDRRVGDVTALAFSDRYGLVATTADRDWLTFDLQGGTLATTRSVGIAPIRGATGMPVSIADLGRDALFVGFSDNPATVARYAMSDCGTNAAGIPWVTAGGTTTPIIVQGAYSYLGIAAAGAGRRPAFTLSYQRETVSLRAMVNPFVTVGERLIALGNPAQIVPYILAVTRPVTAHARGATLRFLYVEDWSDVRGGGRSIPPRTLLRFIRSPSTMATIGTQGGVTTVILAFPTRIPGAIDLYRFDIGSADLDPFTYRP